MSTGKHWVTEPNQTVDVMIGSSGFAAEAPMTVLDALNKTVTNYGKEKAMAFKKEGQDEWTYMTWDDYKSDCVKFAKALIGRGVDPFSVVNIIGFNSPEWFIATIGSMLGACIGAGIYATNLPDACKDLSLRSKTKIVVLEGNKQLEKYVEIASSLPDLTAVVVYGCKGEEIDQDLVQRCAVDVFSWSDFLEQGSDMSDDKVDERSSMVKPGTCASLIYTSGTTGPPKAVMISHDNITWTAKNMVAHYMDLNHTERVVSYLPLSHIAAQLLDIYCMLMLGGCTYFAQPDALKGSLTVTLKDVKPTFFFGVPRVWEKIQEKMEHIGRSVTGLKKILSTWAKSVGTEHCRRMQYGNEGGAPWGYGCANALVLSKIKEALGLECTKGCFTAAAPIAPETVQFFAAVDIPLLEVFGQSECTGPHTVSGHKTWKIGSCGRPMLGTQSRLDPNTGELQYRGRHIFMGYMYMPDKTAESIDDDGWFLSGDIATFDEDNDPRIDPPPSGFMHITGRIKDLIITAGGENVPPTLIENEMKGLMPAVSNCLVVGDKRKFLAMLVSLKVKMDPESGRPTDELAADALHVGKEIGSTAATFSEAKMDPLWKKYVEDGVKAGNAKTTSNAQRVNKWDWLPEDFSEKEGDLTPTLKLKRNVVTKKYADLIDSVYGGKPEAAKKK